MSKNAPHDMPPLPPQESSMTPEQVRETLDQVLCVTLKDLMEIAEHIRIDHGNNDAQGFLMNLVSSIVASTVYACISGPEATSKTDYRILKNNVQEAVAGGFHGGFFQYAPKSPADFICRVEVMPQPLNNLNH